MEQKRKKTWPQKVEEVEHCLLRCREEDRFSKVFYKNLFFLNPKLKDYFNNTDWNHQHKALHMSIDHIIGFFDSADNIHHKHIVRIGETHSHKNMNIHPHSYYYWIDAMILTVKQLDKSWHDDLEYYFRECLFFPVSFIISMYHK